MKFRRTFFSIIAIAITINALQFFALAQVESATPSDSPVSASTPFTEEELHLLFSSDYIPLETRSTQSGTDQETIIYTSDQTPITALIREEMTLDKRQQMQAHIASQYPNAYEIDPPSYLYNCHAYAWYNTTSLWIGSVDPFISDCHTQVIAQSNVRVGDIVVYYADGAYQHSAIIEEIQTDGTIICVSKWGSYGLYRHEIDYVYESYIDASGLDYTFYRYKQNEHAFSVISIKSDYHIIECGICAYYTSEDHSFTHQTSSSSSQTAICATCSYSIIHTVTYTYYNANMHLVTCPVCNYSYRETHTGTSCDKCQ